MQRSAPPPVSLSLPNVLTYLRLLAVPVVAATLFFDRSDTGRWLGLAIFAAASVTDWLDGYIARRRGQESALGRMLDPIADKLLVATVLLIMIHDGTIAGWHIWAAIVILCREILVSGLREFLAEFGVKVPVTPLAKWKTTVQMVAIAVLLAGSAGEKLLPGLAAAGLALLWVAAVLTLWTGLGYVRAGIREALEH